MQRPIDPVITFILNPATFALVMKEASAGPSSTISASRLQKIGYRLLVLRCAELGLSTPTRQDAEQWAAR